MNATAESDPRAFFAAERTLLAWLRTGIAVIGLGFLVARFGLFLTMVRTTEQETPDVPLISSFIGIGLVILGAITIGASAFQHRRFLCQLNQTQLPPGYSMQFAQWVAGGVSFLGTALACYLIWSVQ